MEFAFVQGCEHMLACLQRTLSILPMVLYAMPANRQEPFSLSNPRVCRPFLFPKVRRGRSVTRLATTCCRIYMDARSSLRPVVTVVKGASTEVEETGAPAGAGPGPGPSTMTLTKGAVTEVGLSSRRMKLASGSPRSCSRPAQTLPLQPRSA